MMPDDGYSSHNDIPVKGSKNIMRAERDEAIELLRQLTVQGTEIRDRLQYLGAFWNAKRFLSKVSK